MQSKQGLVTFLVFGKDGISSIYESESLTNQKVFTYIKVTFAPNLAKKLSSLFYYLILLFQLSVANPENFEEFKAWEVLKIRKEKSGILTTFACSLSQWR